MDAFFCKLIRIGMLVDLTQDIIYSREDVELSANIFFLLYSRSNFGPCKRLLDSVEITLRDIPVDKQGSFSSSLRTFIIYIYVFWIEITLKLGASTAHPGVSLIITYNCDLSSAAATVVSPAPDNLGGSVVLGGISAVQPIASSFAPIIESIEPVKNMLDRLTSVGDHVRSVVATTSHTARYTPL
jgi:hypothetical protein